MLIGGRIVAVAREEMTRGQAERLFPLLEEVLAQEGAVWQELDAVAVGTGPGNFTGTRIAVSAARGLSMSLGVPAIGVSRFDVVRHLLNHCVQPCVTVLPAPRDQWLWQQTGADGERLSEGIAARTDFVAHTFLDSPALIETYPEELADEPHYTVGDLSLSADARSHMLLEIDGKIAQGIARLAALRMKAGGTIEAPTPLYIRPADAAPPSDPPPVILP